MEGMSDIKNSPCQVKIGSGQQMSSTVIGTKHVMAIHKDGTRQELKLVDCRYVPELWVNLFSVNKALTNGFKLSNNGLVIKLTKKNAQIQFDRVFETGTGNVIGVTLMPKMPWELANLSLEKLKPTNFNKTHGCMGHAGEGSTRWTAAYYGLKLQGKFDPCKHCGMARAD